MYTPWKAAHLWHLHQLCQGLLAEVHCWYGVMRRPIGSMQWCNILEDTNASKWAASGLSGIKRRPKLILLMDVPAVD
jgi:hypothetical protein